jgi:L-2-hydroxycarboxylate dehydrogenase (NAD+)
MTTHNKPVIDTELWKCDALESEWLHEIQCDNCKTCSTDTKVLPAELEAFVVAVLEKHGTDPSEGRVVAKNLISADQRGIFSHGTARLGRYLGGIKDGYIIPGVEPIVTDTAAAIAHIDARNGLGQVVSELATDLAIEKASDCGVGIVTVKNSNHYGIAGYYVLKMLEKRMLGICMTNSAPLVIPTFGVDALLGTNPIAFGMPSSSPPDFLLDMATSVVPRGKLEVYDRQQKQMPIGWAADENGEDCQDPTQVLKNLIGRIGGGILPLGGAGEAFSGYKGFGLAMMVDMLCGVLAGSAFGPQVNNLKRDDLPEGEIQAPRVGHFFMALDVSRFMSQDELEERVNGYLTMIKESPKAKGKHQIFIHGEKEHIRSQLHANGGVPIADNVFATLCKIADGCGAPRPKSVS